MLQEVAEKSEENTRIHKHKTQKMTKSYTKVKGENEKLYIVVIMIFCSTWMTIIINGVATDLFCTGVIGHRRCMCLN